MISAERHSAFNQIEDVVTKEERFIIKRFLNVNVDHNNRVMYKTQQPVYQMVTQDIFDKRAEKDGMVRIDENEVLECSRMFISVMSGVVACHFSEVGLHGSWIEITEESAICKTITEVLINQFPTGNYFFKDNFGKISWNEWKEPVKEHTKELPIAQSDLETTITFLDTIGHPLTEEQQRALRQGVINAFDHGIRCMRKQAEAFRAKQDELIRTFCLNNEDKTENE